MSVAVWFWWFDLPETPHSLPYFAQSPVTNKRRYFETVEDINEELAGLEEQIKDSPRTLGQELYYVIPFFADPNNIVEDWMLEKINEYNLIKRLNIPPATDLESASAFALDCYSIIENEMNACMKHAQEKNG